MVKVYTDTKKTWNMKKLKFPKDVFYYKFVGYPHHGTGQWVAFDDLFIEIKIHELFV